MIEKRRSRRIPVQIELSASDIYNQEHLGIKNLESPIQVVDISAHGIGMIAECVLPLGYYFDAMVCLSPELPRIHAVVKIVRVNVLGKGQYRYGCEFAELAEMDKNIIETFRRQEERDYL